MKSISLVVYFTTIILIQHGVICLSESFLSSPGNSSILVFLDLHGSYQGNMCADPDWSILELAHSLQWKAKNDQAGNHLRQNDQILVLKINGAVLKSTFVCSNTDTCSAWSNSWKLSNRLEHTLRQNWISILQIWSVLVWGACLSSPVFVYHLFADGFSSSGLQSCDILHIF